MKNLYKTTLTSVTFLIFLFTQLNNVFIGGNTYDEQFLYYEAGKIYNKIFLFFQDREYLSSLELNPFEFYGYLVIIPLYILSNSSKINFLFNLIVENFTSISFYNPEDTFYTLSHSIFTLYVFFVLLIIFRKLTKMLNWEVSYIFIIFLILIPSFSGHALFNIKDIPFALHFFLAFLYYFDYFHLENNKSLINLFFVGLNFALVGLIRMNAIVFLGLIVFISLLIQLKSKKLVEKFIGKSIFLFSVYLVLTILGSPSSWVSPYKWITKAVNWQLFYSWNGYTLTNGKFIYAPEISRTYLLEWFVYKLPLNIFLTIPLLVFLFYKKRLNLIMIFSILFIFLVNILFFVFQPAAYDGIRQFLFLIPFYVIILSYGIYLSFDRQNVRNLFIIFNIFYLFATQYGLGPYRYVYFNELTNLKTISDNCEEIDGCGTWPTDYWGFSGKELSKIVDAKNLDVLLTCKPPQSVTPYIKSNVKIYRSVLEVKNLNIEEFYTTTFHRPRPVDDSCRFDTNNISYKCEIIDSANTILRGEELNLSYLSFCTVSY